MNTEQGFSVKQLAKVAGVSTRTLHYYDEIGLLSPIRNPHNGYRLYDKPALYRLQQILFLRELGLSLDEIQVALDRPEFDLPTALEQHRTALLIRRARLDTLIGTVDNTINHLRGSVVMDNKALFTGFSEEEETRYTAEARQRYGSLYVDESVKRWGSYSKEKKQQILEGGRDIHLDLIQAMPAGPESPAAQACVRRWHQNLRHFYEPTPEILLGLGDLYNVDPRFNATFNSFHPELAPFMREVIRIYHKSL